MQFFIHPPPHTLFAAQLLSKQLKSLGHEAEITRHINIHDKYAVYIIYNAAAVERFPVYYIVMQTEIAGTHWFNQKYLYEIIPGAMAVWEYSEYNLPYYSHEKRCIVTPGVGPQSPEQLAKLNPSGIRDIPVLFYGWINGSPRRQRILDNLNAQGIPIVRVTNMLGLDLWTLLARTKVVLNLHYHDFSPLETYRINEALSFGCKVVTETDTQQEIEKYRPFVTAFQLHRHWIDVDIFQKQPTETITITTLDNLDEVKAGLALLGI